MLRGSLDLLCSGRVLSPAPALACTGRRRPGEELERRESAAMALLIGLANDLT
jgi:hypothetical protein